MVHRDNCFDFLRLLFASVVLFGHLICISQIPQLQVLSPIFNTHLAVTGFFVISGFLIAQSYDHSSSWRNYIAKRCRRLLPAYFMVVLCCALGMVLISSLPYDQYFFSKDWWQYLLANLTFLNFLHPTLPGVFENELVNDASVNPSLWTLKIEVAFYIVLPLIMLWQRKAHRHWIPLMVLYVLSICYHLIIDYVAISHPSLAVMSHQLPRFMSYFMAGTVIYIYQKFFLHHKNKLILPALIIWVVEYYILHIEIFTPLCYSIMVIWFAYSMRPLNNIIRWGDISYGVYIYNGPILKTLLSLGIFAQLGLLLALPLYLVIVFAVSLCSWNWVEKPLLKR